MLIIRDRKINPLYNRKYFILESQIDKQFLNNNIKHIIDPIQIIILLHHVVRSKLIIFRLHSFWYFSISMNAIIKYKQINKYRIYFYFPRETTIFLF